jgi:hypothetical protein
MWYKEAHEGNSQIMINQERNSSNGHRYCCSRSPVIKIACCGAIESSLEQIRAGGV